MQVIKVKNKEEMSQLAANYIIEKVKHDPKAVLGLATGSTPKETYINLVKDHEQNGTDYSAIKTINLDEYVGVPYDNKQSYHYFMNENLFRNLNVNPENQYIPEGMAEDLNRACRRYDQIIEANPIDIQLLGIGENGHIGFNEPGTSFDMETHVVKLAHSTRKSNARFFKNINEVPTQAITMGIASILRSKEILLLASGESKAKAMKQLIEGEISEEFPASVLKKHPHVTIITDDAALRMTSSVDGISGRWNSSISCR